MRKIRLIDADAIPWTNLNDNPNSKIKVLITFAEKVNRMPTIKPKKGKWIPCSERLPNQGQEVICQCRANIIKVLKLDANGDWYQDAEHCYMSGFVIAWMPLPEPYNRADMRGEEE